MGNWENRQQGWGGPRWGQGGGFFFPPLMMIAGLLVVISLFSSGLWLPLLAIVGVFFILPRVMWHARFAAQCEGAPGHHAMHHHGHHHGPHGHHGGANPGEGQHFGRWGGHGGPRAEWRWGGHGAGARPWQGPRGDQPESGDKPKRSSEDEGYV